jgi:hypothetical protein
MPFTEKTYTIDAVIKNLGVATTYDVDAIIVIATAKTYSIDVLTKKLNIPKTYSVDAAIQKQDITKTYSVDVQLETGIRQVGYLLDVGLKKLAGTLTYALDVRLRLTDGDVYNVDTILKRIDAPKTYSIDTLIQELNLTKAYSIDTKLKKLGITSGYSVDCQLTTIPAISQISNSGGTLALKILDIRERQRCIPAIRDVPTATSVGQLLDTGTWVLGAKTLELKVRLSSDEKDTLKTIYDTNDKVTVYLFNGNITTGGILSDSYWKHIGWLATKDFGFEYSKEDDADRPWIVNIEVNVETYTLITGSLESDSETLAPADEVSIYGYDLVRVLDFEKIDKSVVSVPDWVDSNVELDTNVFVRKLTELRYLIRATHQDKFLLDALLQSHTLYELKDCEHCLQGNIWIQEIESEWDPINWKRPWRMDISLIAEGTFTSPVCCTGTDYDVDFASEQDNGNPCTVNQGQIIVDGSSHSLPYTEALNDLSTHTISWTPPSPVFEFDHWETTGDVSVDSPTSNPTTLTVSGVGTVTAIFKQVPL